MREKYFQILSLCAHDTGQTTSLAMASTILTCNLGLVYLLMCQVWVRSLILNENVGSVCIT